MGTSPSVLPLSWPKAGQLQRTRVEMIKAVVGDLNIAVASSASYEVLPEQTPPARVGIPSWMSVV